MKIMKFIKTYESFESLTDEQKSKLQSIIEEIKDGSMEKGEARNPFYDRGERRLDGLGEPFGSIVPGSVSKDGGSITAEVSHGVKYSSGLRKEYKSVITMDAKTLEYVTKKISTDL